MAKPEIGLSMLYLLGKPFRKMVEAIPETGMIHVEIVDDGLHSLDKRKVAMLKSVQDSCAIKYSVHAPFAGINIAQPSKYLLNATFKRLKKSISHASTLGCEMWVFHPGMRTGISMFYPSTDWARSLKSVDFLVKFARDHGVNAALENVMDPFIVKTVEEYEKFFAELNENVGLVLDTGHANIYGQVNHFAKELSSRIVHVHAHDNHGRGDEHLGIGYGNIDWKAFSELMKASAYDKAVMIESVEHIEESVRRLKELLA